MLLAVDVGNTQTVAGLMDDGRVVNHWRVATVRHRTADELAGLLYGLLRLEDWNPREVVTEVAIASVVPRLTSQWQLMCEKHLHLNAFVIGPGTRTGMRILMKNPTEVGADRIVNAVAAFDAYGGPCVVVDFGTATTFDVVDENGDLHGVSIAPGVNLALEALHSAAASLPRVAVDRPATVIGKSTVPAMQSGIFWGYISLVEGLVARIKAEFGRPMKVVATGGLAPLFNASTDAIQAVDGDLTIKGLREVFQRNAQRR